MMDSGEVHIVLVANERYRRGLEVTKASMIAASREPARLVFHEFGDEDLAPFLARVAMEDYNGSKLPYLRLFLPELLPAYDWVLYSDVDTVWDLPPEELFALRDDSKSICWVRDLDSTRMSCERATGVQLPDYACSGVCLINLAKWRREAVTARCLDFLTKRGCPTYADQDVLNVVLKDDAKLLPLEWDRLIPPYRDCRCVYHITGVGQYFHTEVYAEVYPQYAFWCRRAGREFKLRRRWRIQAALSVVVLPVLAFLDSPPGPFRLKVLLQRLKRRFAYARLLVRELRAESPA